MLGIGIIAPVLPLYAKGLGASSVAIGLIIGSFSFSRIWGMLVSGELAERMDRKKLLIVGLLVYAAASVAYTFASSTAMLIFIRIWHGIGSAMVVPITMAIATDIAPKGKEGAFFGSLQAALFLGIGFGPLLSGFLADSLGFLRTVLCDDSAYAPRIVSRPPPFPRARRRSVKRTRPWSCQRERRRPGMVFADIAIHIGDWPGRVGDTARRRSSVRAGPERREGCGRKRTGMTDKTAQLGGQYTKNTRKGASGSAAGRGAATEATTPSPVGCHVA